MANKVPCSEHRLQPQCGTNSCQNGCQIECYLEQFQRRPMGLARHRRSFPSKPLYPRLVSVPLTGTEEEWTEEEVNDLLNSKQCPNLSRPHRPDHSQERSR